VHPDRALSVALAQRAKHARDGQLPFDRLSSALEDDAIAELPTQLCRERLAHEDAALVRQERLLVLRSGLDLVDHLQEWLHFAGPGLKERLLFAGQAQLRQSCCTGTLYPRQLANLVGVAEGQGGAPALLAVRDDPIVWSLPDLLLLRLDQCARENESGEHDRDRQDRHARAQRRAPKIPNYELAETHGTSPGIDDTAG
jgi:hypothetical protein